MSDENNDKMNYSTKVNGDSFEKDLSENTSFKKTPKKRGVKICIVPEECLFNKDVNLINKPNL